MSNRAKVIFACAAAAGLAVGLAARARRTSYYRVRFGETEDRIKAAKELADKPKRRAVGSLIAALDDEDAGVRASAVAALAQFGAREALARCRRVATQDEDARVRAAAVGFLRQARSRGNARVLTEALKDKDPHVRAAAVKSLVSQDAPQVGPAIVPCLADPSELVREAAVDALGRLKCREAAPKLIDLLDAEDEVPLSRIQEALVAITGRNFGIDADDWREGLQATPQRR